MPAQPANRSILLLGGGGHALVVAEAALGTGFALAGFFDDDPGAVLASGGPSAPRRGTLSESAAGLASGDDAQWIIAVGDLAVRRRLINSLRAIKAGDGPATIIHPTAWVSPSASIGRGVFIGPRAVVHTRAVIGDHAIINTGSIIEHECQIAENVHAAPGSVLGGRTRVGPDTLIGIGARTLPGISIGREAVVGCGAAVVREVPDSATVAGVPARLLKQSP